MMRENYTYSDHTHAQVHWIYSNHQEAFFSLLACLILPSNAANLYDSSQKLLHYIQSNLDPKYAWGDVLQHAQSLYQTDPYALELQWLALKSQCYSELIHMISHHPSIHCDLKSVLIQLYEISISLLPSQSEFEPSQVAYVNHNLELFLDDLMACRQVLFKKSSILKLVHIPSLKRHARAFHHASTTWIACDLTRPAAHCFCQILHEETHQVSDALFFKRYPHLSFHAHHTTKSMIESHIHPILEQLAMRHASRIIATTCPHRIADDQKWKQRYTPTL